MTVPMRAIPVEDDAGALVLRYQQRIRAELLRKAADETSWKPRFRLGSKTYKSGEMPPLAERIVSVLQTFSDQRQFVTSGMVLSLVTAATSSALILGSPGPALPDRPDGAGRDRSARRDPAGARGRARADGARGARADGRRAARLVDGAGAGPAGGARDTRDRPGGGSVRPGLPPGAGGARADEARDRRHAAGPRGGRRPEVAAREPGVRSRAGPLPPLRPPADAAAGDGGGVGRGPRRASAPSRRRWSWARSARCW